MISIASFSFLYERLIRVITIIMLFVFSFEFVMN